MGARKIPLTADQGSSFTLAVRLTDPDGTPHDLTTRTAQLVRLARTATETILDTHPATTTNDGWVTVNVTDTTTSGWDPGRVSYRLELTPNGGVTDYLLVGPFTVRTPADV